MLLFYTCIIGSAVRCSRRRLRIAHSNYAEALEVKRERERHDGRRAERNREDAGAADERDECCKLKEEKKRLQIKCCSISSFISTYGINCVDENWGRSMCKETAEEGENGANPNCAERAENLKRDCKQQNVAGGS